MTAVFGPTLPDLTRIYDEEIDATVQLLSIRGFGVFAGKFSTISNERKKEGQQSIDVSLCKADINILRKLWKSK